MTRSSAKMTLLCVLLALALAGGAFSTARVFDISGQLRGDEVVNTTALCSLRADVRERVASTIDFLQAHPHGIPGVPVATILVGLNNEQHTLYALHPLAGHCQHP